MKPASNACLAVRPSRPSTKSFFDFNEILHVGVEVDE